MIFLQPNWIIAFVCAFTFYGMGKAEARGGGANNGVVWGAGWLLVLLGQIGLFIGIGIFRALRDRR